MGYLYPVPFSRSTSWSAHKRRNPPSTEAGIDMFCPIGTPVLAAGSGRIVDTGDSIGPATGRFVTIDLDDGRRVRYLHLSRRNVSIGARVSRGQVIGYSGATGYGEEDWSWNVAETGGAHVHMTLWPLQRYVFGGNGTLDPANYFDPQGSTAGGDAVPLPTTEEEDMPSAQEIAAAVWGYGIGESGEAGRNDEPAWKRLGRAEQLAADAGRLAAPLKLYTYGTGVVAVNSLTGNWMILGPGYPELLVHLGLAAPGSRLVNDDQFRYATSFVPAATGLPKLSTAELSDADLEEIKAAIEDSRVAVTPEQLERLTEAVSEAARTSGEEGARKALADLTFVVTAS